MSITGSDDGSFLNILNDSLVESDIGSASDSDYVEKSDHDSSSEFSGTLSSDSETEEVIHERSDSWIGRDRVCSWNKQELSKNVRTRPHNIYSGRKGPRSAARHAKTPCEIWSLFMTKDVIDVIVLNTNIYIGKIRTKYVRERSAKDTDENEIKALLGLLLLAGVFQSNRFNLCDLYNTDGTGVENFPSTMSLQRLRFLLRCLRFVHPTRSERKRQDKLAAIRMVFDTFVRNCTENYMHSAHVTIDEVLVSFKGRCPFRMYIPSKTAKYGIKIFELSDSETYYVSKMEVYVGKQNEGPHQMDTSPAAVVKRLCSAIVGTGRNITMDNWFMSYSLVEDLLKEKLTAVGTMRKNKRQIPAAFIESKHRELNSSLFGYQKNMTLVSYVPKKNKNVILLSSMHHDGSIVSIGQRKKPEIVVFYNKTKSGVDHADQLAQCYNTARKSQRWPLAKFFHLLNVSVINACVIHQHNSGESSKRKNFIKNIAFELLQPYLRSRLDCKNLTKKLRLQIDTHLPDPGPSTTQDTGIEIKKKRCKFCPRKEDIKTKTVCSECASHICSFHSKILCIDCAAKTAEEVVTDD
ncbi:PiggyBac transposable element-derived protein 4 [Trichinella sp. T8]|nr:PiggyBac transposable element-derived protein 4 [Trichinella sp. T8]